MSIDYCSFIERSLASEFGEHCSIDILYEEELRFSFSLQKIIMGQTIRLVLNGSEARVVCNLDLCSLSDPDIKGRILGMLVYDNVSKDGYMPPYKFTLWQGNKDFKVIPNLESLSGRKGLTLELSSPPCEIAEAETGALHSIKISKSFFDFLHRDIFCEDMLTNDAGRTEGREYEILATRYERSPANRRICIAHFGCKCQICEVNLTDIYGEVADGFIHVHHVEQLACSGEKVIDPTKDLIPVCPNCHGIIHRTSVPLSPERLKGILNANNGER